MKITTGLYISKKRCGTSIKAMSMEYNWEFISKIFMVIYFWQEYQDISIENNSLFFFFSVNDIRTTVYTNAKSEVGPLPHSSYKNYLKID